MVSRQSGRGGFAPWGSGCSAIAITALTLISAPAGAQSTARSGAPASNASESAAGQATGTDAATNADIVVTAQFRSQRLQDTPIAITAVNSEMLTARGQTNISQVAAEAPNVNLQRAPSTFGPAMQAFIRGVGQSDSNIALQPGVGLYVDDVYYSTLLGSMLELLDLDRVEILRGPQGTLAGQNSIGGAIKLYSKIPTGDDGGFLEGTYGSYHKTELRGAAGFTIVPDHLFARLSGVANNQDGYVTRYDYRCTHPGSTVPSFATSDKCKLGTEGGKSYGALRGTLRWEPTHGAEFTLIGDYTKDNSESAAATLLYVGSTAAPGAPATAPYSLGGVSLGTATGSPFITYSPFGNFSQDTFTHSPYVSYENYLNSAPRDGTTAYSTPAKNYVNTWGVSGRAKIDISDVFSVVSITAYRSYNSIFTSGDSTPLNVSLTTNDDRHTQFSQEVRLNGSVASLIDFTVGGYYLTQRDSNNQRVQLPTLEFVQSDRVHQVTKAAFANADVHPFQGLDVIGGIRYTDLQNDFFYGRLGTPGSIYGGAAPPSLAPLNGLAVPFSKKRVDYRATVQYRWSPGLMTYAQFSTGFRSGGANPRPFFPSQAINHGPETLNAYEIGFKSDLFDRRIRLNGSAFINKYKDILVTVSTCPVAPVAPCALPINAGAANIKGFELESTFRLVKGLLIDASLGYLDFNYTSLSPLAIAAGLTTSNDGPFVQRFRGSVGTQYTIDAGNLGTFTPRLDVNFQSRYFSNPVNRPPFNEIPARTILNGHLTYQDPGKIWGVTLEVNNLTDKLYYDGIFDNRGSTSFVQGSPALPRTWQVSIRRNF
ncbi:TonB-dependent receptor [Rhizorhabdus dicambivorans]|uniref:TonB-dependent receptor n=1 Tax=Rhizorhabdus dicambivorans TaxID=1850238 RepID=A0A2A4FQR0_9SPHN|nr:TonB-dependent receptor [Rhizorhabdus dicambivorans]ATE65696.1 TonB-dependent receptor [Rhizorhabdus dicambivorans]PCE40060.1 TonB-dependent receptor [Rhizorhabdus dicambivorans]